MAIELHSWFETSEPVPTNAQAYILKLRQDLDVAALDIETRENDRWLIRPNCR